MAQTKLGDNTVNTNGNLPAIGSSAPDFTLVTVDFSEVSLKDYAGKNIIFNIFPTIDTGICSGSVREFNKRAASLKDTAVLCVSKDLPLSHKRFCGAEGIENVISLSDFRNQEFSKNYGTELIDGKWSGLHARAIVVADKTGKVVHTELVPSIGQEPDYDSAIKSIR